MYQFTPEDIQQKLLDLQTAFEKCMSQPKPDMVLANQLRRDIAFYAALQKEYTPPTPHSTNESLTSYRPLKGE